MDLEEVESEMVDETAAQLDPDEQTGAEQDHDEQA